MSKTNPARGMRDFLPVDVRKREYVIGIIKEVYESYGYEPLETPAVENIDTLMGKYGEEGNQLIFKILMRGEKLDKSWKQVSPANIMTSPISKRPLQTQSERNPLLDLSDLALRYDLTVPLARVVADRHNELPKFFKRYQIQPVWRADRPARGRFREFYQCDVDAIGSKSMLVEAELISAVSEILTRLRFKDFVIKINHRDYLIGWLEHCGVSHRLLSDALVVIDKMDKIGWVGVREGLIARGANEGQVNKIKDFLNFAASHPAYMQERIEEKLADPTLSDDDKADLKARQNEAYNIGWLEGSEDVARKSDFARKAVAEIKEILELLRPTAAFRSVRFEPSLARGLSYYTGTIMEINVPNLAGSLGGGGRYDGLIGMFGKEQIPACGFSLGLERILVVMDERGMFPPEIAESRAADVMVTIWSEDTIAESLKLVNELRKQGLRVLLYPEADKLGKQIKYADSIGVPFVCVLGESEVTEGKVTVKNMESGEQESVERKEVGQRLKSK